MKKNLIRGMALLAVCICSCATQAGTDAADPPPVALSFTDTRWILVEIGGKSMPESEAFQRSPFLLFQSADNRYFGNGGVNNLRGTFSLETGGLVTISGVATTLMAGLNSGLETEFTRALSLVDTYAITGNTLTLSKSGGEPILRFMAFTPAAIVGSYSGIVPGANSDIKTLLTLKSDSAYVVQTQYIDKSDEQFEVKGKFTLDQGKGIITLDAQAQDMPVFYAVGKNTLTQLDSEGRAISGDFPERYILKKQ